ncbi:MAG TPA: hypothetical protein VMT88_11400 [Actinomycetes bacterium]|nr:hypothetical protein [Actinomycetes bacterium]
MSAQTDSVDAAQVTGRDRPAVLQIVGFALGVTGAAWFALVFLEWWGQTQTTGVERGPNTPSVSLLLLVLGLAISLLGWWLTSPGFAFGLIVLAMSRSVAAIGSVLAGDGVAHTLSMKFPSLFGASFNGYSCCTQPWSYYLKIYGMPVVAAFALAACGFALERRLNRAR